MFTQLRRREGANDDSRFGPRRLDFNGTVGLRSWRWRRWRPWRWWRRSGGGGGHGGSGHSGGYHSGGHGGGGYHHGGYYHGGNGYYNGYYPGFYYGSGYYGNLGYGYGYGSGFTYPYYNYGTNGTGYAYPGYGYGYSSGAAAAPMTYAAPAQGRYLGIDEQPVTDPAGPGMKVVQVYPGSAAQQAGLQPGDVILSANGYVTQQHGNLAWIISTVPPNGTLALTVHRASDGAIHVLSANLP